MCIVKQLDAEIHVGALFFRLYDLDRRRLPWNRIREEHAHVFRQEVAERNLNVWQGAERPQIDALARWRVRIVWARIQFRGEVLNPSM